MQIEQQALSSKQIVCFLQQFKQSLRCLIIEILQNNTAYDCMSINNSVCSINKNSSIYDAINIIINEGIEQLLVWDESLNRWIWMLTIADAIRLIMHSLKTIINEGKVNFRDFQKYRDEGLKFVKSQEFSKYSIFQDRDQIFLMIQTFQKKKIAEIILEINNVSHRIAHYQSLSDVGHMQDVLRSEKEPLYSSHKPPLPPSNQRPYIRLKSVVKQTKLSFVIMAMIVQKIHRVLVEDVDSKMIISILSFKDILLYLVRIANESETEFYNTVTISSLLDNVTVNNIQIQENRPLWEAFELMTDGYHSRWINVVDRSGAFKGLLFREDFRDIFKGWHINYLWMSAGQFIKLKESQNTSIVPEYRLFGPTEIIKEIIWKIVMTRSNTIVWVDEHDGFKVKATIGLMELFSLFVH